jgi:hypothetical protein
VGDRRAIGADKARFIADLDDLPECERLLARLPADDRDRFLRALQLLSSVRPDEVTDDDPGQAA